MCGIGVEGNPLVAGAVTALGAVFPINVGVARVDEVLLTLPTHPRCSSCGPQGLGGEAGANRDRCLGVDVDL